MDGSITHVKRLRHVAPLEISDVTG